MGFFLSLYRFDALGYFCPSALLHRGELAAVHRLYFSKFEFSMIIHISAKLTLRVRPYFL